MHHHTHRDAQKSTLISLSFFSQSTQDFELMGLMRLLLQSYLNNQKSGITGMLFYDGKSFSQIMEGPAQAIDERWQCILTDYRHEKIHLMSRHLISSRQYSTWSMRTRDGGIIAAMFPELAGIIDENNINQTPYEMIRSVNYPARMNQTQAAQTIALPILH